MGVLMCQFKSFTIQNKDIVKNTEFWLNFKVFGFVDEKITQDDNSVYTNVFTVIVHTKSVNDVFVR